jgi:enoyl-CoA hydratase
MATVLRTSDVGAVRVLTLNRPEARNALNGQLVRHLYDALHEADEDPGVAVIVLHGADPAFCAGVDLKEAAREGPAYFEVFDTHNCVALVGELLTPVIGAVNGATFTGGLELALGCDVLIASDRALFADTHLRAGVLPGGGLTARLPRVVGHQRARRMSLTGEVLDATQALRVGLVTEVVPHEDLLGRALALAQTVAEVPPELARTLKAMYQASDAPGLAHALASESALATEQHLDHSALARGRDALLHRRAETD